MTQVWQDVNEEFSWLENPKVNLTEKVDKF